MIKIIPAILEEQYLEIENKINTCANFSSEPRDEGDSMNSLDDEGYVEEYNSTDEDHPEGHRHELSPGRCSLVQIDVCDGVFTHKPTWPFIKGVENDLDFKGLITEKLGLPHWEDIDVEIDLMCANPIQHVEQFIRMGASKIIIHKNSAPLEEIKEAIELVQSFGVEAYLAVPFDQHVIGTPEIQDIIQIANGVQIMSIIPGLQHQKFNEESIKTAQKIREEYPTLHIQIDGAENEETIPNFIDIGVDTFVVGSAIFGSEDPIGEYEFLSSFE